jgi:tetratricopeptide (TPR) repeat protein
MSDAFRSSDEFDEQAHQLYNEGRYDDAMGVLREGISLYPNAVELHVGLAYAYLAREEFAWARRAFESALVLDPDHEDALAGMGETLLRLGQRAGAIRAFERILDLGYSDDHDLMLQVGRALFREGLTGPAHRFFELAIQVHSDSADAAASIGYAAHRLGRDGDALYWLRRALALDPEFAEARIYLANMLYDRGESDAALHHLERTRPEDHFDELGIWRMVELKRSLYRLRDGDPELVPWMARLDELTAEPDTVDMLLAEIEAQQPDGTLRDPNQLELFAALLSDPHVSRRIASGERHEVVTLAGAVLRGTWEEIVQQMKDAEQEWIGATLDEFMLGHARRGQAETGVTIPVTSAEAFVRGSAAAGVVRIVT